VYRSDEDRDAAIAPAAAAPAPPELVVVEVLPPRSWRQAPDPPNPEPSASPSQLPQRISYGALSFGLSAMMLPLVVTMFVVMLPVRWLFGTGESRMNR
jgi:hypothetical protein